MSISFHLLSTGNGASPVLLVGFWLHRGTEGVRLNSPVPAEGQVLRQALCGQDPVAHYRGMCHILSLDESGSLWNWGWGLFGQLGIGDLLDKSVPHLVGSLKGVSVIAGSYHSFVFTLDCNLMVFGLNACGQLGFRSVAQQLTPTLSSLRPFPPPIRSKQKGAHF